MIRYDGITCCIHESFLKRWPEFCPAKCAHHGETPGQTQTDEACSLTNPYQSDLKRFVLRKVSSSKHVTVETLQPTLCAPETVAWSPIQAPRTIAFTYWHDAKFITNSRGCHVIWSETYAGLVPGQLFGIIIYPLVM